MPSLKQARITSATGKIVFTDGTVIAPGQGDPVTTASTPTITAKTTVSALTAIPHNIYGFIPGPLIVGDEIFRVLFTNKVQFVTNFGNSLAKCSSQPSIDFIFSILVNDAVIGTLTFPSGTLSGTFVSTMVSLVPGDIMSMLVQSDDQAISDLLFTLTGMISLT
jgi:hypothetical protein